MADTERLGPAWGPKMDFRKYAADEDFRRIIHEIRAECGCETWQAWLVFCALMQTDLAVYGYLMEQDTDPRQPWEQLEDEDE